MKIETFIFYHPIRAIIEAQMLQFICKEVKGYLPSIVRELYSNFSENPNKEFLLETIVFGMHLSVDLESIVISLGTLVLALVTDLIHSIPSRSSRLGCLQMPCALI